MVDFRQNEFQANLPLVTIAMSSYNYARYIQAALDSLLTQTYPNIELIIVDDCSKDNSAQIIETWIRQNNINCIFIKHPTNRGITKTSNELVRLSHGKYITLFASDDIMLPERITKQAALLEEAGDEYGMSYARPRFMDDDSNPYWEEYDSFEFFNPDGNALEDFITRKFGFITPTGMIRRSGYEKVGMYDERVLIEDYNFFLRLVACYKVKYCDYPCIVYRWKREGTPVFRGWYTNNYERYFYDRVLSNQQALKFMPDDNSREMLIQKITQYLKSMAAYNSDYFFKTVMFLLRNGYTKIPARIVAGKVIRNFKSLFFANNNKQEEIVYD